jgi:hypothetical protein
LRELTVLGCAYALVQEEVQSDLFQGMNSNLKDMILMEQIKLRQWRMLQQEHKQDAYSGKFLFHFRKDKFLETETLKNYRDCTSAKLTFISVICPWQLGNQCQFDSM